MSDELTRLRAADPLGAAPPAVPPPPTRGGPGGRRRRVRGAIAVGVGTLALGGLIGALIVAAPSGDEPAAPAFEGPLRIGALERAQVPGERTSAEGVDLPGPIAPTSTRLLVEEGARRWYLGRLRADRTVVCLFRDAPRGEWRCGDESEVTRHGLLAIRVGEPGDPGAVVVGVVPDGIGSVFLGDATAEVADNAVVLPAPRGRWDAVLLGPAAVEIDTTGQGAALVATEGDEPTPAFVVVDPALDGDPPSTPAPPPDPPVPPRPARALPPPTPVP